MHGDAQTASGSSNAGLRETCLGHADRIWKMLDDMSANDPEAYAEFIGRQARDAGADYANAKEAARRAAEAPEFSVQRSTDEVLFGSSKASGHADGASSSATAGGGKGGDVPLIAQLLGAMERPSGRGSGGSSGGRGGEEGIVRPTRSPRIGDDATPKKESVVGGARASVGAGGTGNMAAPDKGPTKRLITEIVDDMSTTSVLRLPTYTILREARPQRSGESSGLLQSSPYSIQVTAPELKSRSCDVDVSLVRTGIGVSISGCKELFIPLQDIHGDDDARPSLDCCRWEATAKRSAKKATLTITVRPTSGGGGACVT